MPVLLSLETSTYSYSCALHNNNELIAFKNVAAKHETGSHLAVSIEEIFKESGLKKKYLNGVIVAAGPGSYTGLRIAVATAKGICYALGIPLISVNTLLLMVYQFSKQFHDDGALLCPMLDARRMEIYCLLTDNQMNIVEAVQAKVIDDQSFIDYLEQGVVYFFGPGSDKCKQVINHPNAKFISGVEPLATSLGLIGLNRFLKNEFEAIDRFEPLYLKDFLIKKPKLVS